MLYKFNESLTSIVEDNEVHSNNWFAAHIYSEMQDRIFMILSKDVNLLETAYNMFMDVIESESGSTETAFNEFDEFVKSNNLVFLDDEINLEYDRVNKVASNTETGEVYDVIIVYNYAARF